MTESSGFQIVSGGPELLDRIGPQWNRLREHHAASAPMWANELLQKRFEERKGDLLEKGRGGLLVLVAVTDTADSAYCIGTIDEKGVGEIDSLFVEETHRGRGMGSALLGRVMQWFTECRTSSVRVELIAGNDQAMRFYERWGFAVRSVRMVQLAVR